MCILERWKPMVLKEPACTQLGLGWSHWDPLYNFWKKKKKSICELSSGTLLQPALAGAQVRVLGLESQGRALEHAFLTSLSSRSYTNWRTRATGVYIPDQTILEEWNQTLSPRLRSDGTGSIVLPSVPGPDGPFWPLLIAQLNLAYTTEAT